MWKKKINKHKYFLSTSTLLFPHERNLKRHKQLLCIVHVSSLRAKLKELLTFSDLESISTSAILAHFCQKFGSSREMSVRFPDEMKLA